MAVKMTAQLSVLISLLLACSGVLATDPAANALFQVVTGPWSSCSRMNASLACYRMRQAACVRTSDNLTAPWYYCNFTARVSTVEACPQDSCAQNCAVSLWSAWSSCDCSSDLFRIRTRIVVSPARNGGQPCTGLLEREVCECASLRPFESQPRSYTWRTGEWGECSVLDARSQCGVGLRSRMVECMSRGGGAVLPAMCLQEVPYSNVHPPSPETSCEIPCPCILGEWEPYSPCTPLCDTQPLRGEQTRTRPVIQSPTLGLDCEPVKETRTCSVNADSCPVYVWDVSTWSPCIFQTRASCGAGHVTRNASCTAERNGVRTPVEDSKCRHLASVSRLQSCHMDCPQPCQLGGWSDWTECLGACQPTYSNRTRPVIVPPLDEEACPHTLELRPCPVLECPRYQPGNFTDCFLLSTEICGMGTQSRSLTCIGVDNQPVIGYSDCSEGGLALPDLSMLCHKPCPNDCVVSDWSEWSLCSEQCGGRPGNRTRRRHLVANGPECPSDLFQTELCSDPRECEPITRYYIQPEPWGDCTAVDDNTVTSSATPDTGVLPTSDTQGFSACASNGVRNRTNICMRNDRVVPVSDCPIDFEPVQLRSCELPCVRECGLSEWTSFSECSSSCGPGTKYRTRHVLQFPTSDLSECVDMQFETASCPVHVQPCEAVRGVSWYETPWSSCHLYSTINENEIGGDLVSGTCGLGFQNRTMTCMEIGTGVMLASSRCLDAIGSPPSAIRSCHLHCSDRCLVTEWSDFTTCVFDGNTTTRREVVPRIGCSDTRECCPELASVQLTQFLACPSFPSCYSLFHVGDWTDCILESPVDTCGNGHEYRSIVCFDMCSSSPSGGIVVVDFSFCPPVTTEQIQTCNIKCQRNCVQSEWDEWGPCSATCGHGLRSRMRTVVSRGEAGGRPCANDTETDVCVTGLCPRGEFVPGPFEECVAENSTSLCGPGLRSRQPLCLVDGEPGDYATCEGLGATVSFPLNESCVFDCPGECVTGEWAEWSACGPSNCPDGSCQQSRLRKILRDGSDGCTEMTQEFRICYLPSMNPYLWNPGAWRDCIIIVSPLNVGVADEAGRGHYCGEGVHTRVVTCVDSTSGLVVADRFCTEEAGSEKPTAKGNCTVPCPVDCVVGAFSDWTECQACVYNDLQSRRRPMVVEPLFGGEACPDLEQAKPCIPTQCTSSARFSHTPQVAPDYTEASQCGSVRLRQPVSCRNNTLFMSPLACVDRTNEPQEMYRNVACPSQPNCTFGAWSAWSECTALCLVPGSSFSFRTRQLVSSLPGLAAACEAEQLEQRECRADHVTTENGNGTEGPTDSTSDCVDFAWRVSEWNQTGRNVHCLASTGTRVENSGCPHSTMPRSRNETCVDVDCPDRAVCSDEEGVCMVRCNVASEKVQGTCLPKFGCFDDGHCLRAHMRCDTTQGRCECEDNYEMVRTINMAPSPIGL